VNQNVASYDPWAVASNPPVTQFDNNFWGQVQLNVWAAALVKGTGKVPYDPNVHDHPVAAIDLAILPLAEMDVKNTRITERNLIAESKAWREIVWESLRKLSVTDLRSIQGKYAHVEAVDTGEIYEKNGETKHKTEFKFLALFDTEAACLADYLAYKGGKPANGGNGNNGSTPPPPANNEKNTALQFLTVIVKNACKGQTDVNLVRQQTSVNIAQYPLVSKHFTVDSPEVAELIMKHLAPF
jgi:hypothetical protein